ncbi:DoxX family protein [Nocardia cyriacigeorgica]|uniref:DoxX family protein n=2 Tax=Nocardia cyriacigeorgica TaxID=135487 RepID=A0A6P1D4X9_9NOCA|nr:DoxX family protein [Nocardia cyriacigeorgica]NEW41589.1 DoxX family protein [Nocardia cyriacigeorgica]NEW44140.1 DoxX family protein [Nocardia cyriacigeorgica]NEW52337.1 DoxX family protein [Nocardia cyriacigeorgica]NEW56322.1 DoxX family protein [Nocardia cyriacigeorgica]
MDVVVLIGRVLFVMLFFGSAFGHFTQTEAMTAYAQSRGVPSPKAGVLAAGVLMVLGGVSVLLGVWADLGALLLFIMLAPTALLMHQFWVETDPEAKQTELIQFNKDLSLAGASLMLFAFFAHTEDLGLTITGPLFSM